MPLVANSCFNSFLFCVEGLNAKDHPQGEKETETGTTDNGPSPKGKHWERPLTISIIQHNCCTIANGERLPAVMAHESWPCYKGRQRLPLEEGLL